MRLHCELFKSELRFVHAIAHRVESGIRQARPAIFKAILAWAEACIAITSPVATRVTARIWPAITKAAWATGLLIAKLAITPITATFITKAPCI